MNRRLWIPALGACAGLLCGQAPQAAQNRGVLSPEIEPDRRVTFRLAAAKAAEVILNGDWESGSNMGMQKDERGVWTATVGPLAPELWSYSFTVDGVRMLDPANVDSYRDGRRLSSIFIVPGAKEDFEIIRKIGFNTRWLETHGAHTWITWRMHISQLAPLLFDDGRKNR